MSSEIKPNEIVYIETYPRIGIARVGNSKEYYIGPEIPGRNDTPDAGTAEEGFKDKDMKVKRQAARFRVYAFGENHEVLGELNSDNGFELAWEVEVANKKPSYYTFMGRTQPGAFQAGNTTLRNPTVQPTLPPDERTDCIIAPGPKTIKSNSKQTIDMTGHFKGSAKKPVDVYLGSIKVDDKGRLLVLPGHGSSYCIDNPEDPWPLILTDFDNPNWVDDTCDGTVRARVSHGKDTWYSDTAHIVCTTPKYASAIYAPTTLYDVMENIYAKKKGNGDVSSVVGEVEYWRDIWDLIQRPVLLSWVNGQANGGHGPGRMGNFFDPEWQKKLQSTLPEHEATRKIILGRMRLPYVDETEVARRGQAFKYFMPWLSGDGGRTTEGDETTFSSVTELQYARLKKWADGDFVVNPKNRPNPPPRFEDIKLEDQPVALTRASLEWTIGAPLYPGIELSWNAEEPETYDLSAEALSLGPLGFRLNKSVKPGELTRYLSLPWQSDFYMCRNYWWPSARPDAILSQKVLSDVTTQYGWDAVLKALNLSQKKEPSPPADALANHVPWERGIHQNYTDVYSDQPLFANTDMVQNWHKLGFIVRVDPPGQNLPVPSLLPVERHPTLPIFAETQRQHPHPQEMKRGDDVQNPNLPVFALNPQALTSFKAHTMSRNIEFCMPRPDNRASKPPPGGISGGIPKSDWGGKWGNPPITTLPSLKKHLHFAMAIELSTIPLYLYAMYSIKLPANKIKDPRFWDPVTGAIRGIIAEEMLHLTLAGNVLKAVGGTPKLYAQTYDDVKIFPTYNMVMPGRVPKLEMKLRQAIKPNFDTFLGIELPQGRDDPPAGADEYHTLGQFYEAVKDGASRATILLILTHLSFHRSHIPCG
ncbi:ferritin-like-domain-containing protein [Mycena maculata]|uniref:Ferritin-like-domain-containing protein n=1 Tax=Mycena maculata TaxID=230809 RepID=A0AAD7K8E9_9AGAR|nr:ferritin-like-domain-containing protein [Mycena maculata]